MKWKIGNVKIDNQVVLAPMSGVCDSAFRTIAKSMGCGLLTTEMVSARAIMYGSSKSKEMLYTTDYERPISQQIFGPTPELFETGSKFVYENMKPDIIDINMGCPTKKVAIDAKSGSALLKTPEKVYDIVKTTVDSVPIPVSVKIRSGWDKNSINAVEIAKIIEDAGASAVCVHPRTRSQGYEGTADLSLIKEVKNEISIPVIGNGDIKSCYDAKKMIDQTGCDAVMIGRGVLGNPWLIKECVDFIDNNMEPAEISLSQKKEMIKKHANLLMKFKEERIAMLKMRTHASYYVKNIEGNGRIKEKIFKVKDKEELFQLVDSI